MNVDVLVDLQRGDCGKGKIAKVLNEKNKYSSICKYNGGGNAGHAVWIGNKKYTAHYLTSGVYNKNTNIVIGPGCVLDPDEFLGEMLQFAPFNIENRTYVHANVHLITQEHKDEDSKDTKIGTTRKGTGPCYGDKYRRVNQRAGTNPELTPLIYSTGDYRDILGENVLMEGSQGYWLDIDHGTYPYVTSSHIHPAFAFTTFGIPMQKLRTVYGVAKIYETYVGNSDDIVICDPDEAKAIVAAGAEYGETTGRERKIGYLNIDRLIEAINQTGVNVLFINKTDVLEETGIFRTTDSMGNIRTYENMDEMLSDVNDMLFAFCGTHFQEVRYSGTKDGSDL